MDVREALDTVVDEESFVRFLKALADDRADEVEKEKLSPSSGYASGANGWEHSTIEDFLEAVAAWAEVLPRKDSIDLVVDRNPITIPGYTRPDNPWKRCADIIYAGKIYE